RGDDLSPALAAEARRLGQDLLAGVGVRAPEALLRADAVRTDRSRRLRGGMAAFPGRRRDILGRRGGRMNRTDALVEDYLRRLERAAYALPPERRAELLLEIRGHISEARDTAAAPADEAWTRTLLDRLGTPEEIVAAAELTLDPS